MNPIELNRFRQILETVIANSSISIRQRDGIAVEKRAESAERMMDARAREIALRNLENESAKLREARAALRRIKEGTFGLCLDCEDDISPRRLAAVPWTPLCVRCQEAHDREAAAANELWSAVAMAA
jgi:DnaK suppressor protein